MTTRKRLRCEVHEHPSISIANTTWIHGIYGRKACTALRTGRQAGTGCQTLKPSQLVRTVPAKERWDVHR